MCIAIYKPKESEITKNTLKTCWESNPHGAGLMYAINGKVKIAKELKSFKRFLRQFREHEKAGADMVIHFRIMTHGKLDFRNTHPHRVNKDTWLVHNGIISEHCYKNASLSDTVKFCKMIAGLPQDFMKNRATLNLISGYIDTDKMILLNRQGKIQIINEDLGVWDGGVWYSNQSYETVKMSTWYDSARYYSPYGDDTECIFCQVSLSPKETKTGICEFCESRTETRIAN